MAAPYPIYIKKKNNAGTETAYVNTETQFGMVVSEIPFRFVGDVKEPYGNDWKDEHGADVYLPDEGLKMKSYDMDVTFIYKGPRTVNNTQKTFTQDLRSFINYLTGNDSTTSGGTTTYYGSRLTIYDTYNAVGRQDIYVKSISPDVFVRQPVNNGTTQEIARFTIKFTVCDPMTDVSAPNV